VLKDYYLDEQGLLEIAFIRPPETMKATIVDPIYSKPIPDKFLKQVPAVWLYHHDNAYFEYLVCEGAN
jgi:hypothetical protein